MRTAIVVLFATLGLAFVWAGASAQQEVRPTPGPGSGMVTVRGTVDVGNVPTVMAAQAGEWRVAISSAPPLMATGPDFLVQGGRYAIVWPTGDRETVHVVATTQAGWAQVEHPTGKGARRWVNLGVALAVEEVR